MENIRGLSSFHKDMEAASETSALVSPNVRAPSGKQAIAKFFQLIDFLFPGISWNKSIVWISIVQIVVYVAECIVQSNDLQPTDHTLLLFGGLNGPLVKAGQVWRLIFPVFLHAGLWHVLLNVFSILVMSLAVETRYGTKKFLILYFTSGILGNLLTVAVHPCSLIVGASTAGFGIISCLLCELALAWSILSETARRHNIVSITVFLVLIVIISLLPSVDLFGHIGGFVAGVAITLYYNKDFDPSPKWLPYALYLAALGSAAIVIGSPVRIWAIPMEC